GIPVSGIERSSARVRPGRQWLFAAVCAALLLTGCDQAQKGFEDGFEKQFTETFTRSCEAGATRAGAPADKVDEVCKCAADELAKTHSPSELMQLSPEDAVPVMEACAKKTLAGS